MRSKICVVMTFEVTPEFRYKSCVRIMSATCVRFTFGNYVIKPCKWNQKLTLKYVWELRYTNIMLELR